MIYACGSMGFELINLTVSQINLRRMCRALQGVGSQEAWSSLSKAMGWALTELNVLLSTRSVNWKYG